MTLKDRVRVFVERIATNKMLWALVILAIMRLDSCSSPARMWRDWRDSLGVPASVQYSSLVHRGRISGDIYTSDFASSLLLCPQDGGLQMMTS